MGEVHEIRFAIAHADGEGMRRIAEALAKVIALRQELLNLDDQACSAFDVIDRVQSVILDAFREMQNHGTIPRRVHRSDLTDLIDQAFGPLMATLSEREAPDALLCVRDLHEALTSKYGGSCGRGRQTMAVLVPEDEEPYAIRSEVVDLRRRTRAPLGFAKPSEATRYAGLILPEEISPAMAFAVGRAAERGVILVSVRGDLPGVPSFPTLDAAVQWLGEAVRNAAPPEIDPHEEPAWRDAAEDLRERLLTQENAELRDSVAQAYDRHACRIAEIEVMLKDTEFHKPLFEIVANGSRMGHESTHTRLLSRARHQVEMLKKEKDALRFAVNGQGDAAP